MRNYQFTEISQKVFNRNRNRIVEQAIETWNIQDNKSKLIIKEYFSEKLNKILNDYPNTNLDLITVEF